MNADSAMLTAVTDKTIKNKHNDRSTIKRG